MINDSAVEILQVRHSDFWPPRAFIESYPGGQVDIIESLVPYYLKASTWVFGDDLWVFRLAMAVLFGLTTLVMFFLFQTVASFHCALLGSALYALAPYSVWYPYLLTRNAATPLVVGLVLLVFQSLLKSKKISLKQMLALYAVTVLGLLTYSSLKAVLLVFFVAMAVRLLWKLQVRNLLKLSGAAMAGGFTIFSLLWFDLSKVWLFFERGSYVLKLTLQNETFWEHYSVSVVQALKSPFLFPSHTDFFEPSHLFFASGTLPPLLWPFFLGGVWAYPRLSPGYFRWFFPLVFVGTLLLVSVGGPSLKGLYSVWPFYFFVVVLGLVFIVEKMPPRPWLLAFAAALLLTTTGWTGFQHYKSVVYPNVTKGPEIPSYQLGAYLSQIPEVTVYYRLHMGLDLSRLMVADFPQRLRYIWTDDEFLGLLKGRVTLPGVILLGPSWASYWTDLGPLWDCEGLYDLRFSSQAFRALDRRSCL